MPTRRAPKTDTPAPAWQPQVGDRVSVGTESVYTVTRVNATGTQVDLQLPNTNIERFRVSVGDLVPVMVRQASSPAPNKPARSTLNIEDIRERMSNVQHSSMEQLDGDIAILTKYLKTAGVSTNAIQELNRLRSSHKADWDAAIEAVLKQLE